MTFGILVYPKDVFNSTIKTRLSNSFFIGEIVGQLAFGVAIDRIGRKAGVLLTTSALILGVILSAAAHGKTDLGLFWMLSEPDDFDANSHCCFRTADVNL